MAVTSITGMRLRRPRHMRRLVALAGMCCLVVAASGCGDVEREAAAVPVNPPCATDPARDPGAPLVVWHNFESIYLSAFEPLVHQWENETGRTVELVAFSSTDAIVEAFRDTAVEQRPDLMTGSELTVAALADSGQFAAADDCAGAVASTLGADLVPAIADTWSTGGTLWAVPFAVSIPVLLLRAAALDAIGASAPTTPAETASLAAALVAAGYRTGIGFDDGLPPVLVEQWAARTGEPMTVASDGERTATADGPAASDALTWLDGLVDAGLAVPVRGGQPAFFRDFIASVNPLPMVIASSAAVGAARLVAPAGIPAEGPPVVVGLPLPGAGALAGGSAWWLPVRPAADQLGAFALAAWLAAPAQQAAFTTQTGFVPVTSAALDEPALVEAWASFPALGIGSAVLATRLQPAVTAGIGVGPRPELRRTLGSAFERVRAGQSVADALSGADAEFQAVLDVYARTVTDRGG